MQTVTLGRAAWIPIGARSSRTASGEPGWGHRRATSWWAIGKRQGVTRGGNDGRFHGLGSYLVTRLVNHFFRASVVDVLRGYRAFSRQFVDSCPILGEGIQIETEMTLHVLDKRLRMVEVPAEYRNRPEEGASKVQAFSDGIKVLFAIFQILRYCSLMLSFGASATAEAVGEIYRRYTGVSALRDFRIYRSCAVGDPGGCHKDRC